MSTRRVGTQQSATRTTILDATEALMLEEGYGAVSSRAVAAKAGVKPALVQYYFPKMDDLWVAVSRRAGARVIDRETEAVNSDNPVRALWEVSGDPGRMALGLEFMALANHRKALRGEIAIVAERARELQAEMLSGALPWSSEGADDQPALGLAFLITAISRSLVMEQGIGVSCGHAEAIKMVERWLQQLETPAPKRSKPARRSAAARA